MKQISVWFISEYVQKLTELKAILQTYNLGSDKAMPIGETHEYGQDCRNIEACLVQLWPMWDMLALQREQKMLGNIFDKGWCHKIAAFCAFSLGVKPTSPVDLFPWRQVSGKNTVSIVF